MAQSKFTVYKVVTIYYPKEVFAEDESNAIEVAESFGYELSEPSNFEEHYYVEAE